VAVLNLEKSEFSVLYRNKVIYYRVEVEKDTTSIPNPKTVLNRSIKMKGIDAEGNSGIILIFLGTQSHKFGAYIFNKQQSFYYTGKVIAD
jgi:hypothetical protein